MSDAGQKASSAPDVDLVFDAECPNVEDARALLRTALIAAGFPPEWREWLRDGTSTPLELKGFGSPTILVNGSDVSGSDDVVTRSPDARYCRLYRHAGRYHGVPPLAAIAAALQRRSAER